MRKENFHTVISIYVEGHACSHTKFSLTALICGKMQNWGPDCDSLLIRKNDSDPITRKRRGSMRAQCSAGADPPDKAVPVSRPEARPALQLSAVPGGDHTSQHNANISLPARKTVLRVFGCAIRPFSFINIVGKAEFRIRDVVERIRIPYPYHWTTDPDCRWGPGRFSVVTVGYVLVIA